MRRVKKSLKLRTAVTGRVLSEMLEGRVLLSTFVVNTTSDASNPGAGLLTLRQAVADANAHSGSDTIDFSSSVFAAGSLHTITLTQGQITFSDISGTTTLSGPGASVLAVSGGGASRVFQIDSGVTVAISGMENTGGKQTVADSSENTYGGAIYNEGTLSIGNSTIT